MTSTRSLAGTLIGFGLLAGLAACGDHAASPAQPQAKNPPAAAPSASNPAPSNVRPTLEPPAGQAEQGETRPRQRRARWGDGADRGDHGDRAGRPGRPARPDRAERDDRRVGAAFAAGPVELAEAQREKLHGRLVEFDARVTKILGDDRKGLQHQRFIVTADGAGTILIAHNIDLAGHVPVAIGGTVRVHGLFEWTPKGGIVHWTHHDPSGKTPGGWIRCGGKTYS